ncbi:hypothetical protein [Virgisporangium ochraceum]|jgi:hypothetical protein|uniref:Uncharacterized protein n=1 Tax=Virgisporangium ochraceum TaxID=65505 RepID=A0A8J4A1U0_9ACTN|nr:hypothetical protein [Virgisporangium ochraceum]GIJ71735.1 hypothetical protein Voc01_066520 [Virgisporangium ochraceum]
MRVDPLRLRQLGHDVQDDAADVRALLSATGNRLAVTGTAAAPWQAAGAASGVTDAWRVELEGAAGRLKHTGELFVRAAEDYMATDAWSASRIGQSRRFE